MKSSTPNPSWLASVFRYRQRDSRSPREDFICAALACLLQRDLEFATRVSRKLSWVDPADRSRVAFVWSQVTEGENRVDLELITREGCYWVEIKAGAGLDDLQIQRYLRAIRARSSVVPAI
jgi:hypothetical protein